MVPFFFSIKSTPRLLLLAPFYGVIAGVIQVRWAGLSAELTHLLGQNSTCILMTSWGHFVLYVYILTWYVIIEEPHQGFAVLSVPSQPNVLSY